MPDRDDRPRESGEEYGSGERLATVEIRTAAPTDELDVRRLLDAAILEVGDVRARIDANDVLVAVEKGSGGPESGDEGPESGDEDPESAAGSPKSGREDRVLGVIVLEPTSPVVASASRVGAHVAAIAVRKRRRDRGIGTGLIEAAAEREGRLTARFHERVRPFYASLGFEIEPVDDERYEGVREAGGE